VVDGRLIVPLQLLSDILPRLSPAFAYDTARDELRVTDSTVLRVAVADTLHTRATPPPSAATASAKRRHLIVVDAGHGGPDNGMTGPIGRGPKVVEKTVTLAVANQLAAALRARGYDVLMTRTTDTLIALSDRGRIANAAHADLFISVHVNAANPNWKDPGASRGFETYFLAEAKTEDAKRVERMENEAVKFETGVHAPKGDPLSFIMNDMAQNEHLRESSDLAGTIQESLAQVHPAPDRGVRQANFSVLRNSFMPAVLVEIGFGTNASDAAILTSPIWQARIARSLADATVTYVKRYERRVSPRSK
jgi:N-acetylmuramoyl-L-alanine amidase